MKSLVGGCTFELAKGGSCTVVPIVAEWTNQDTGEVWRFCRKHDEKAQQAAALIDRLTNEARAAFARFIRKEVQ